MHNFFARVNPVMQVRYREPNHANFVICTTCLPDSIRPAQSAHRPWLCASADIRVSYAGQRTARLNYVAGAVVHA
jgi:hypothetical protein